MARHKAEPHRPSVSTHARTRTRRAGNPKLKERLDDKGAVVGGIAACERAEFHKIFPSANPDSISI